MAPGGASRLVPRAGRGGAATARPQQVKFTCSGRGETISSDTRSPRDGMTHPDGECGECVECPRNGLAGQGPRGLAGPGWSPRPAGPATVKPYAQSCYGRDTARADGTRDPAARSQQQQQGLNRARPRRFNRCGKPGRGLIRAPGMAPAAPAQPSERLPPADACPPRAPRAKPCGCPGCPRLPPAGHGSSLHGPSGAIIVPSEQSGSAGAAAGAAAGSADRTTGGCPRLSRLSATSARRPAQPAIRGPRYIHFAIDTRVSRRAGLADLAGPHHRHLASPARRSAGREGQRGAAVPARLDPDRLVRAGRPAAPQREAVWEKIE